VTQTEKKRPHHLRKHPQKCSVILVVIVVDVDFVVVVVLILLLRCSIEAHWSHIDSVFGVSVVDLAWCEIDDWKSDVFVLVEFENG